MSKWKIHKCQSFNWEGRLKQESINKKELPAKIRFRIAFKKKKKIQTASFFIFAQEILHPLSVPIIYCAVVFAENYCCHSV